MKNYILFLIFICLQMQVALPIIPWKIFKRMAISAIKNHVFGAAKEQPLDYFQNMHAKSLLVYYRHLDKVKKTREKTNASNFSNQDTKMDFDLNPEQVNMPR